MSEKDIFKDEWEEFNQWNELKKKIHAIEKVPNINEGEIWWCACGKNVGIEINGKNRAFSRPVLVFHKFSRLGFWAIPLTTKGKDNDWYLSFNFRGKNRLPHCRK